MLAWQLERVDLKAYRSSFSMASARDAANQFVIGLKPQAGNKLVEKGDRYE
jgi:hypothetical protein